MFTSAKSSSRSVARFSRKHTEMHDHRVSVSGECEGNELFSCRRDCRLPCDFLPPTVFTCKIGFGTFEISFFGFGARVAVSGRTTAAGVGAGAGAAVSCTSSSSLDDEESLENVANENLPDDGSRSNRLLEMIGVKQWIDERDGIDTLVVESVAFEVLLDTHSIVSVKKSVCVSLEESRECCASADEITQDECYVVIRESADRGGFGENHSGDPCDGKCTLTSDKFVTRTRNISR